MRLEHHDMSVHPSRPLRIASLIALSAILAPSIAGAVSFRVTTYAPVDGDLGALSIGDEILLGVRIENAVNIYGLHASAFGYSTDVVQFVDGETVEVINSNICIPVAVCVGIFNTAGLRDDSNLQRTYPRGVRRLHESSIGANGPRVRFMAGTQTYPTSSYPAPADPGLLWWNEELGAYAYDQALLRFRIVGLGSTVIHIGTGYEGDGEILSGGVMITTADTSTEINVVPEPGGALLLGLGLAALTATAIPARRHTHS